MFIRADAKGNIPLLKHEQTHQRQMADDGVFVFWFRYLFQPKWRQHYEIEAYKVQIAAGASLDGCASLLSSMYFLDINFYQAKDLLKA